MFKKFKKMMHYVRLKSQNDAALMKKENSSSIVKIPKSINEVKKRLNTIFSDSSDFIMREFSLGKENEIRILIAFIEGLADKKIINNQILQPMMIDTINTDLDEYITKKNSIDFLRKYLITSGEISDINDFKKSVGIILEGDSVVYIDGNNTAIQVATKGWDARNIEEPDTEKSIRGPREGFVETLRTNTSLLRRKIKNPNLKFESMKIGVESNTDVCICYIKGIVNEEVLNKVKKRLKMIKIDAILDSGYVEQFIEDAPFSLFPTVGNSEKPDKVAAKLLEGRVAIICDGSPVVLTVPYIFAEAIQSTEDYYSRTFFASFIRLIRTFSVIVSGTLPAIYVALLTHHADVIPFDLLISIASSREGVPFTPLQEAIFMGLIFDVLKEAGIRMPRPVGQAVNIVGALIIGEAAVQAGLVSNIMIIVVALTGITSFIIPPINDVLPIFRIILVVAANFLGLLGMLLILIALFIHMVSLRSFGVPYLTPLAPFSFKDLKDVFIRAPLWLMITRPKGLMGKNRNLQRLDTSFKDEEE